jgi:hypothetical protein
MTTTVTGTVASAASRLDWDGVRRPLDAPPLRVLRARSTTEYPTARRAASITASVAAAAGGEWVTFHEGGWLLLAAFNGAGVGLAAVLSGVWLAARHLVNRDAEGAVYRPIPEELQ